MRRLKEKSGAALITVLVAMMIISIMLFEFQHMAMVERKLAYNELNQLQAYYLAKSGVRIGLVRLVMFARVRKSPSITNIRTSVPNIDSYLDKIWQMPLPPFPPDSAKVKNLDANDRGEAQKLLNQTKVSEGKGLHTIASESSKINLNTLIIPANMQQTRINFTGTPQGPFQFTGLMLVNLLEQFIRDSDNPNEEYPDLKPEELVMNIMDWVNPGTSSVNGGTKDTFYEQQKPPYKAKKGPFYSLEELRLVKGMTERLYQKLKPYVTVYASQGKININNINSQMLKLLYKDITDNDVKLINEEKSKRGGSWTNVGDFVTFVSTLRPNFKTVYPNPDDYFTTGNFSFLIESTGILPKSQSQIQRTIRVAVSLAKPKGGTIDSNIRDKPSCDAAKKYWDIRSNSCLNFATNSDECATMGGEWQADNGQGQSCCKLQQIMAAPASACVSKTKTSDPASEPGALKVLYWSES